MLDPRSDCLSCIERARHFSGPLNPTGLHANPLRFNRLPGIYSIMKNRLVKTLIMKASVKAFDKCLLNGVARSDALQRHSM